MQVAEDYDIKNVAMVLLFKNGEKCNSIIGTMPKKFYVAAIERLQHHETQSDAIGEAGYKSEASGIAKAGAKIIVPVSCVKKLWSQHFCNAGHAYTPNFTFFWPNARISVKGGAQYIVFSDTSLPTNSISLIKIEGTNYIGVEVFETRHLLKKNSE